MCPYNVSLIMADMYNYAWFGIIIMASMRMVITCKVGLIIYYYMTMLLVFTVTI